MDLKRKYRILEHSLRLLRRYPLRSFLLTLSAATGVVGVVCSVNYGAGGTAQLLEQIRRLGTNVLIITPTQSRAVAGRARTGQLVTTLVERDYVAIKREILSRTRSSAFVATNMWTKAGDFSKNTPIVGCEPDYFVIKDWPIEQGSLFDSDQDRTASRVAVLGHNAARDLFGDSPPVGERLMINRIPFTVIGVLSERGQGLDLANEDAQIYVPLQTAMHRVTNVDHFDGLVVGIDTLQQMDGAEETIRSMLRALHRIRPGIADDFRVQNQKSLLDSQAIASRRLNFFLRWIAASALFVSGLGILGVSWIAVKERTREIGTRRALGASAGDVFFQITSENLALSLIGCMLGLVLSWPLSEGLSYLNNQRFVFVKSSAVLAVIVAAALNMLFGLLPSRKAALLQPTEALKYE